MLTIGRSAFWIKITRPAVIQEECSRKTGNLVSRFYGIPPAHEAHSLSQIAACAGFVLELSPKATQPSQKPDVENRVVIGSCRFVVVPFKNGPIDDRRLSSLATTRILPLINPSVGLMPFRLMYGCNPSLACSTCFPVNVISICLLLMLTALNFTMAFAGFYILDTTSRSRQIVSPALRKPRLRSLGIMTRSEWSVSSFRIKSMEVKAFLR